MKYNPEIWGPHYWFFIMSMATNYPIKANEVTKKKYYDFFSNLPLFIPHDEIGNQLKILVWARCYSGRLVGIRIVGIFGFY